MAQKVLTCIECPMGCELKVIVDNSKVISVTGNNCARGKMYAENEVICPKRVITSTVKSDKDVMVAVKTNLPVNKEDIFRVMNVINSIKVVAPIKIGDIIKKDIVDGVSLVATSSLN